MQIAPPLCFTALCPKGQVFSLHENFHTSEPRDASAGHVTKRVQKEESGKVPRWFNVLHLK